MKHEWGYVVEESFKCKACGVFDCVKADPMDTNKIVEERNRIFNRNDCKGKSAKTD